MWLGTKQKKRSVDPALRNGANAAPASGW